MNINRNSSAPVIQQQVSRENEGCTNEYRGKQENIMSWKIPRFYLYYSIVNITFTFDSDLFRLISNPAPITMHLCDVKWFRN